MKRIFHTILTVLIVFSLFNTSILEAKKIDTITITLGESHQLSIATSTKKKITWKTSNKAVATVNKNGKVKARKVGTATITAKIDGASAKVKFKVIKAPKKTTVPNLKDDTTNDSISDNDKKLYEKAHEIIDTYTKSTNTPFENETIIHDYLVNNVEYDYSFTKDSYSSYGALINGKAVCQGYAEAFKLLMDILEIECIVVVGTADNGGGSGYEGHAWNLVKLDGEWYNVDVTWDDPTGSDTGAIQWTYFNVTDSVLSVNHKWKTGDYPKATGTKYNYVKYNGLEVNSVDELKSYFYEKIKNSETNFEVYCAFDISSTKFKDVLKDCIAEMGYRYRGLSMSYSLKGGYYMRFNIEVEYDVK